jgi:hypothetical protein
LILSFFGKAFNRKEVIRITKIQERERMPKKRKRKKTSAYGIVAGITLSLAVYVYFTTHNLIIPIILAIIALGIVLVRISD